MNFGPNRVELIGHYGSDETHALSAWTSSRREITDEKMERLPKFLRFLAENGHHTPFEKSYLHFLVKCDNASHIHLLKHRVGVSVNGESARYKELKEDQCYLPYDWPEELKNLYKEHTAVTYYHYHRFLEKLEEKLGRKRAKESARFLLPYGNQLVLDVGFNFRSFMHFMGLRMKEDAQCEIFDIANDMLGLVHQTGDFDISLKAFGYL